MSYSRSVLLPTPPSPPSPHLANKKNFYPDWQTLCVDFYNVVVDCLIGSRNAQETFLIGFRLQG
ncbi:MULTISPECIES: hypothetical protein [Nostocales]|uniref:Uncharacterized protein n=3 Tax=Nostocales TaxID=1161 RepID=A0A0C1NJX4_9CYAN|nr:hypothetical protein [Tolypothrix bouteillei]KAF3887912.1 hypothetical protein DA73_0400022275 [Tolypothrix bouteillei VB521301]